MLCPLQTAADNYALLQKFLERYPHLRPNDLHLASESYGGKPPPLICVKTLVESKILRHESRRFKVL